MKGRLNLKLLSLLFAATGQVQAAENYVSYQHPKAIEAMTLLPAQPLSSNEYWHVVSGEALRQGVDMTFTSDKSVVLLSPRTEFKYGQLHQAQAIEHGAIRLYTDGHEATLKMTYDSDEMAGYGFVPGSSAVQANQLKGKQATLRLTQLIDDNDSYLLHVKETDSPYQLTIDANNVVAGNEGLKLQAQFADKTVPVTELNVSMRAPDGEIIAVTKHTGLIQPTSPLTYVGARQGLYAVEMHSEQNIDGLLVKRSIRVPFVNQHQTARILDQSLTLESPTLATASVQLEVEEAGRYGVTATVFGYLDGKLTALATSEAAQDFVQSDILPLSFKLPKGAKGPFKLTVLELKDQTRLQRFPVNPQ
jgi:hypothetical protein